MPVFFPFRPEGARRVCTSPSSHPSRGPLPFRVLPLLVTTSQAMAPVG